MASSRTRTRASKNSSPDRRDAYLRRTYGISSKEYDKILKEQSGVCDICGRPPAARRLAVDHDHKTGLVRGLLCWYCNKFVLGRHSIELIRGAFWYLEHPPANAAIGDRKVPERRKRGKRSGTGALSRVREGREGHQR